MLCQQLRLKEESFYLVLKNMQMYDKKNLARLKQIDALAPEVMEAFWAFDKAAFSRGEHSGAV
jgi:hypothetical protein